MVFVSSFGYYFKELSYGEKMHLQHRSVTLLLLSLAALLLLPTCLSQRQRFPGLQLPPLLQQQQQQEQQEEGFLVPLAEFFCQGTPLAPTAATQQQCVQAFTAFNFQRNVQEFCRSVGTFCTAQHLTLCPRPATATACRTCVPLSAQLCQQG